ncbi:helix-turn-helix domain-containing protein [Planococcus sp. A6]
MTELAFRYGYNDASTYSKAVKKHMGMSPSAFRTARNDKSS